MAKSKDNEMLEEGVPAPEHQPISAATRNAILYGIASLGLYIMLFLFNDPIVEMAEAASRGDKSMFFVPIIIAFIFSIVHGAFTGYFWEALGLKAKK